MCSRSVGADQPGVLCYSNNRQAKTGSAGRCFRTSWEAEQDSKDDHSGNFSDYDIAGGMAEGSMELCSAAGDLDTHTWC